MQIQVPSLKMRPRDIEMVGLPCQFRRCAPEIGKRRPPRDCSEGMSCSIVEAVELTLNAVSASSSHGVSEELLKKQSKQVTVHLATSKMLYHIRHPQPTTSGTMVKGPKSQ